MKRFDILGDIVDTELEKMTQEDVCPKDFKEFSDSIEDNDTVEIHVNSCGGSVTAGISIANMILALSKKCKTAAYVDGLAASIASVICMAADELHMSESSFLMIHRVWGTVQGNCEDLRKEADIMEKMNASLLSFYHRKFGLTDDELNDYLKAETWISGADAKQFKLDVIVDACSEVRYAAKLIQKAKDRFHNSVIIERLKTMEDKVINEEETSKTEELKKEEQPTEVAEEVKEEVKEEEQKPTYEELEKKVEELTQKLDDCMKQLDECKPDEDVEKRVSGMQSKMQNKINDLNKEFKDKLELANKELQSCKDECISLKDKLETTSKELSEMTSAYEEKKNALATLNASVNTPDEKDPNEWRKLKGKEFFDWLEANKDKIKQTK